MVPRVSIIERDGPLYIEIYTGWGEGSPAASDSAIFHYCIYIPVSLAGQTLTAPSSKRGKRVWKLWPEFCDGCIDLHGTHKSIKF